MVVPTYPEGGSHALQVCQHHHQVVRVGHCVELSESDSKNTLLATAPPPADSTETFTVSQRAQRVLCYREGGGRWPARPRVRGVLRRKIA